VALQNGITNPITVTFTVNYADLSSGYYVVFGISSGTTEYATGSASSAPDSCLSLAGTKYDGRAVCVTLPSSISGTETATFSLYFNTAQQYSLEALAVMTYNSNLVNGSTSTSPFTISVNSESVSNTQTNNNSQISTQSNLGLQVSYHNGLLFPNSNVYLVFWGDDWNTNPQMIQQIYSGLQTILNAGYFDDLDQYGFGSLTLLGYTINDVPSGAQIIPDQSFRDYANSLVASGTIPKYYSQVIFVLPPRQDVYTQYYGKPHERTNSYDTGFWGYHFVEPPTPATQTPTISLSIIQPLDPTNTQTDIPDFSQTMYALIMRVITHETVEAITDPSDNKGWSGSTAETEIADQCVEATFSDTYNSTLQLNGLPTIMGVPVSYYWSDSAGTCVAPSTVGGLNGLETVALQISGLPTGQCTQVTWTTNLQTISQSVCEFTQWQVRGAVGSTVSVSANLTAGDPYTRYQLASNSNSWTISTPVNIPVNYVPQYYVLVQAQPSDLSTITGTGWYDNGTSTQIVAPQFDGYTFLGWTISTPSQSTETNSVSNPLTLTVNQPIAIIANYQTTTSQSTTQTITSNSTSTTNTTLTTSTMSNQTITSEIVTVYVGSKVAGSNTLPWSNGEYDFRIQTDDNGAHYIVWIWSWQLHKWISPATEFSNNQATISVTLSNGNSLGYSFSLTNIDLTSHKASITIELM